MNIKYIQKIIESGIDGQNANVYAPIINALRFLLDTGYISDKDTITIKQLKSVLYRAYQKQDRAIEKYLAE